MKRLYVSGPMTGLPDLNRPAFMAAAQYLRAAGFDVVNPAELDHAPQAAWVACMRLDIAALMTCDTVVMLPGWQASRGANIERRLALDLDLRVIELDALLQAPIPGAAR